MPLSAVCVGTAVLAVNLTDAASFILFLLPVNWKEENDKARIYSFDHRETTCSPHLEKLQLGYFLRWDAGISKSFWPPLFCSAAHHSTPPVCCYNNMEVVYFKRRRRRWRRRFPLLIKNAENWIRKCNHAIFHAEYATGMHTKCNEKWHELQMKEGLAFITFSSTNMRGPLYFEAYFYGH